MSEVRAQATTSVVKYVCDACEVSKMQFTGRVLTCMPPKYVHICPNCGEQANLDHAYPRIVHELAGSDGESS